MKPVSLEFCGVNSFSEPAKIDFAELLDCGIFGIFGDTGSGKSTILDCIGFALYGNMRRVRTNAEAINFRSDKAYVKFSFEIVFEGKRRQYLVERELLRKGTGTARVSELTDGRYVVRADSAREANAFLERAIGLRQQDFERCIALPQGEFAQFVKAEKADRLKLISRLFDLEELGEKLNRKVAKAVNALELETATLSARLEQYREISEEGNRALEERIASSIVERDRLEGEVSARREDVQALRRLLAEKEEGQRARKALAALEENAAEMRFLESALERFDRAALVLSAEKEGKALRANADRAGERARAASQKLRDAAESLRALSEWDEEAANAEIVRLTELCARAESAKTLRENRNKAALRLQEVVRENDREAKLYPGFDYTARRAALEAELDSCRDEDFLSFAEREGKEMLLRSEYRVFAEEIESLTAKHPAIEEDSLPLSEKYRKLSEGERTDFKRLRSAYEAAKAKREEAHAKLTELERQRSGYAVHLNRLQNLQTEFQRLKEQLKEYDEKLADIPAYPEGLAAELKAKQDEYRKKSREKRTLSDRYAEARAEEAGAAAQLKASSEALEGGRLRFAEALKAGNFRDAAEAEDLCARIGDPDRARRRLSEFRDSRARLAAKCAEYAEKDFSNVSEEREKEAEEGLRAAENGLAECVRALAVAEDGLARGKKALVEKKSLEKDYSERAAETELHKRLQSLLYGNKFMEYVAEEHLQGIAIRASKRLLSLTDGRYFLRYTDTFYVGDNFNGGALRGIGTLSGGETFLVSLSLALSLGAEICARSMRPIEFFFLDEGFGTLDEKLVDVVVDSLEKLRSERFAVGVISHVEELKHRIIRKITVRKATESRGSQIIAE